VNMRCNVDKVSTKTKLGNNNNKQHSPHNNNNKNKNHQHRRDEKIDDGDDDGESGGGGGGGWSEVGINGGGSGEMDGDGGGPPPFAKRVETRAGWRDTGRFQDTRSRKRMPVFEGACTTCGGDPVQFESSVPAAERPWFHNP
jgi:hypothetical protein